MKPFFALLISALLCLTMPAHAQSSAPAGLRLLEAGVVKEVLETDMLLLDNSERYRLDNILVPAAHRPEAIEALKALVGKKIFLYTYHPADKLTDRYGLPLVHVMREDGSWVQADIVSKGLAWAYSTADSRMMIDLLLPMEADARAKKLGFWADPLLNVKTPLNVEKHLNSFQVVEGKILSVAIMDNYTYLNFGKEWKTDFTVTLMRDDWLPFSETYRNFSPLLFKDRTVTVRGWIEDKNGPMIRLTHPEQMEVSGKRIPRVSDPVEKTP